MNDIGWVNYKEILIWKWTNPLKGSSDVHFPQVDMII